MVNGVTVLAFQSVTTRKRPSGSKATEETAIAPGIDTPEPIAVNLPSRAGPAPVTGVMVKIWILFVAESTAARNLPAGLTAPAAQVPVMESGV